MYQPVHDPSVLRAISHPVRNRILGELTATGPMRAADIARELDIPANQASFHLRQLAKYGLVEEDPDAARDRRDRVWRPVHPDGLTIRVGELDEEPGGRAAARVYLRNSADWAHAVVEEAYGELPPPEAHRSTVENAIRLTREEADELSAELAETARRWVERTRGGPGEGRRTYLLHQMLLPYPAAAPVTAADDADADGADVEREGEA